MNHAEVQLAAYPAQVLSPDVYVGAFENHKGAAAYREIIPPPGHRPRRHPVAQERKNATSFCIGDRWGALQIYLEIARMLPNDDVPVLLTIQVDSVAKPHRTTAWSLPTCSRRPTFTSPTATFAGRAECALPIHRTQKSWATPFDYKTNPVKCKGYPWWDQRLRRSAPRSIRRSASAGTN